VDIKDAGLARGTVITVQDLFFNVPARRKFLKSNQTETSHIINLMTLNSLPYPNIAFKLIDNGKEVFSIEKGMDLKTRIGILFGPDFADALLPVDWKSLEMRIGGYVSKPEFTFSNKSKEYFFVNNRASQNKTLLYAVTQGYRTLVPSDRNPFCFLFISVEPSKVDVNIHPTKRDVRFVNEAVARDAVVCAIKSSLDSFYDMPTFAASRVAVEAPGQESGVKEALGHFFEAQAKAPAVRSHTHPAASAGVPPKPAHQPEADLIPRGDIKVKPFVLGQTNKLYILAEMSDGIVIIDQHAAHERILYEKTMAAIREKRLDVQKLLLPVTVELPKAQAAFVSQHIETMEHVGIGISSFGRNSFIIDAVPAFAQMGDVKKMFLDALEELEEESKTTKTDAAFEEKTVKTLCRLAVKARDRLDLKEQCALVQDLFGCAVPNTCPHGRPTMIKITNEYLAREFKRR
jgi:DNA mismatch repair protein MutL